MSADRKLVPLKKQLEPLAYSPEELAAVSSMGRTRVFELLASGQIKSVKCGRRRLILKAEAERFLASLANPRDLQTA